MLVRLAIVEDEAQLHDYYGKMLEAWGKARNVRLCITYVESAEEFLFKYDRKISLTSFFWMSA